MPVKDVVTRGFGPSAATFIPTLGFSLVALVLGDPTQAHRVPARAHTHVLPARTHEHAVPARVHEVKA